MHDREKTNCDSSRWKFSVRYEYFDYAAELSMTNKKFDTLFGVPPRKSETQITRRNMNLAFIDSAP